MRVRFSSLRCFFFAMRLRRFLMTEPTVLPLTGGALCVCASGVRVAGTRNRASLAAARDPRTTAPPGERSGTPRRHGGPDLRAGPAPVAHVRRLQYPGYSVSVAVSSNDSPAPDHRWVSTYAVSLGMVPASSDADDAAEPVTSQSAE